MEDCFQNTLCYHSRSSVNTREEFNLLPLDLDANIGLILLLPVAYLCPSLSSDKS